MSQHNCYVHIVCTLFFCYDFIWYYDSISYYVVRAPCCPLQGQLVCARSWLCPDIRGSQLISFIVAPAHLVQFGSWALLLPTRWFGSLVWHWNKESIRTYNKYIIMIWYWVMCRMQSDCQTVIFVIFVSFH